MALLHSFRASFVAIWLVTLSAFAVTSPRDARAEEPPVEEARAKMERGQKLFSEGKFAEAMAEFEGAYAKQPFKSFLYNAAVAAERAGDRDRAVARYREFLAAEPNAPDAPQIRATMERLQKEDRAAPPTTATSTAEIRAALVVLSEPAGAPVSIYERFITTAPVFDPKKAENLGWKRVATGLTAPVDLPLPPGFYHVEVEAFRDYRRMGTDQKLDAGALVVYKAGLSQGEFVGKVQIKTPVEGAKVYVDDPPPHKNAPIGTAPGIIEVAPGKHTIHVASPGYKTFEKQIEVSQGKIEDFQAFLERLPYGYVVVQAKSADGYDLDEVEIRVDEGEPVKYPTTEPIRLKLDAGSHNVEIDASGMKAFEGPIEVPRGQDLPISARLEETKGYGPAVGTLLFTGFTAATGAVLFVLRDQDIFEGEGKDVATYVGTGCFIGAGAVLGLSVFFFVYDPKPASTAKSGTATEFADGQTKKAKADPLAPKKDEPKKPDVKPSADGGLRIGVTPWATNDAGGAVFYGSF